MYAFFVPTNGCPSVCNSSKIYLLLSSVERLCLSARKALGQCPSGRVLVAQRVTRSPWWLRWSAHSRCPRSPLLRLLLLKTTHLIFALVFFDLDLLSAFYSLGSVNYYMDPDPAPGFYQKFSLDPDPDLDSGFLTLAPKLSMVSHV